MYRYLIMILMLLPSMAWGQLGTGGAGGEETSNADSIKQITIQDTTGNIFNNCVLKYDLSNNRWYYASDLSGGASDTSLALSEDGGGSQVLEWVNDSLIVKDTANGTQNLYILSHDLLIAILDSLHIGNDIIGSLDGTRLSVSNGELNVDLSGAKIDLTTEVTGELPDSNVADDITLDSTKIADQGYVAGAHTDSSDIDALNFFNKLSEIFDLFNSSYVDSSGAKILIIYADSTDLSIFDTDDLAEGVSNLYNSTNADSIKHIVIQDTSGNISNGYVIKWNSSSQQLEWAQDNTSAGGAGLVVREDGAGGTSVDTINVSTGIDLSTGTSYATFTIDEGELTLSSMGGAVTDGQVPNDITINTAAHADSADTAAFSYETDADFITTVNDDSGFVRSTAIFPFENGVTANEYDLIGVKTTGEPDSLFFLPLLALFTARYADTTDYDDLYIRYSDSSGYAYYADSSGKVDTTYTPLQTYVANHGGSDASSIKGKTVNSTPGAGQDGYVMKYYVTGDTIGWAVDNSGGASDTALTLSNAAGGYMVVKWDNDTLRVTDAEGSGENLYLMVGSDEQFIIVPDTVVIGGDRIAIFDGKGLTVSGDSLLSDTAWLNTNWKIATAAFSDSTDITVFDTDDLAEGVSNKYDQPLPDSGNWSTAYGWGDHAGLYLAKSDSGSYFEIGGLSIFNTKIIIGNASDSSVADSQVATHGYVNGQNFFDIDLNTITDVPATGWRLFYSNASTIVELSLGSSGTYLKSNGASSAPTWDTPGGTSPWSTNGDTTYRVDADGDTTMIIYDDDAGMVIWKVGTEDQVLGIYVDTIYIGGQTVSGFYDTGDLYDTTTAFLADSSRLFRISDFLLYTGGANFAAYDTTDPPSDGQQLTWGTGNLLTWGDPGGGETNTASNRGTSADSLFYQKNGVDLEFRRLIGGLAFTVSASGDTALSFDVDIASDGGIYAVDESLEVKLDGSTLTKSSSGLKVTDGGITGAQLESNLKDSITTAYDSSQALDSRFGEKPDTSISVTGTGSLTGGGNLQSNGTIDVTSNFRDSVTAAYDSSQALDATRAAIRDTIEAVLDTLYFEATISNPDSLNSDTLILVNVRSEKFPSGFTITDCGIVTRPSSSYSVTLQEWTEPDASGTESTIETVATSSSKEAEDNGTIDDGAIAAGSFVVALLPATDLEQLQIWIVATK